LKINEIKFRLPLVKITAIFLSFSLILSESSLYALPAPAKPATISIPAELGAIEGTFIPSLTTQDTRPKTVIYIQDAHDSLEAQRNIAKIIQHLVKQYGVKTVYEEGYEGLVPTDDYFGFIKDSAIKQKVSYFLMDKLRIGGAEYAHINRRKTFKLIGADNIRLHLENIAGYKQSAIYKEETAKDLAALESEVGKLANRYFSKELKDWLKVKRQRDTNRLGLLEYLKRVITVLSRESWVAYPNIHLLLASENSNNPLILEKVKTLDSKVLFQEINALENLFASRLLKTEKNKKIYFFLKSLGLLKQLNDLSVTSAEYEAVKPLLQKFKTRALAKFIASQTKRSVVLSKRWEKNVRFAIRFYDIARVRDEAIEARLDDFILHSDEQISALVFGGFHQDRIKEFLKKRNISYVVVSPRIREIDLKHQEYYQRLMSVGYHSFEMRLQLATASRPQSVFSLPTGRSEIRKIYNHFLQLDEKWISEPHSEVQQKAIEATKNEGRISGKNEGVGAFGSDRRVEGRSRLLRPSPWLEELFRTFYVSFLSLLEGHTHIPQIKNPVNRIYAAIRNFKEKLTKNRLAKAAANVRLKEFINVRAIKSLFESSKQTTISPFGSGAQLIRIMIISKYKYLYNINYNEVGARSEVRTNSAIDPLIGNVLADDFLVVDSDFYALDDLHDSLMASSLQTATLLSRIAEGRSDPKTTDPKLVEIVKSDFNQRSHTGMFNTNHRIREIMDDPYVIGYRAHVIGNLARWLLPILEGDASQKLEGKLLKWEKTAGSIRSLTEQYLKFHGLLIPEYMLTYPEPLERVLAHEIFHGILEGEHPLLASGYRAILQNPEKSKLLKNIFRTTIYASNLNTDVLNAELAAKKPFPESETVFSRWFEDEFWAQTVDNSLTEEDAKRFESFLADMAEENETFKKALEEKDRLLREDVAQKIKTFKERIAKTYPDTPAGQSFRSEVRNAILPEQSAVGPEERGLKANDYPDLYRGVQALFERQWPAGYHENGEWKSFFRIIENGSFIRYGVFSANQNAPQIHLGDIPETFNQQAELIAIENPGRSQRPGQVTASPLRVRAKDPGAMKLVPEVIKNDFSDQYWLEWEGLRGRTWWALYNPYAIFPPKQNAGADEQPHHLTLTRGDGRIYQSRIYQENYLRDILTFWTNLNESPNLQGKKKFRMGINGWYSSRRRRAPKAGASQSQIHAQLVRFVFPIERVELARKRILGPVLVSSLNDGWGTGIAFEGTSKSKNVIAHLAAQSIREIIEKGNSFNVIGIPGDKDQIKVFVISRPLNTAPPFANELGYSEISRAFIGGTGLVTPTFREDAVSALQKVTAPQSEIDSIIQSLTLPLEPISPRSEIRIAATAPWRINIKVVESLQSDVVFVIGQDELDRLSKRQWTELLGLKALNKDKLHIQVLADPKEGMSERVFALQPFGKAYYGAWNPRLPRQAMAIHFSQINEKIFAGRQLDREVAKLIKEHFGIFDGAFGTALLYAYHEGNLEGLAIKNGYRYDPNDVYASRILSELFKNYEIISTAA